MLYRPFGQTGKRVSVIGAGCMRFETPQNDRDIGRAAETLLHAHARGINYFDTAPYYCGDRSEDIVGAAVRQLKPGTFYLSSKCDKADGAAFRKGLERSLQRLGVDRIHFFHIWCLMNPTQWAERKDRGAVREALRAKEEGLIEHLVFSSHMDGEETAAVIAEGIFEGVTLGFNAANFRFRRSALEAAARAGLGVVTMNPLAGGLIPAHPKRFDFIREKNDPDVVTAALRFNLSHAAITCALVGFRNPADVDSALAALDEFAPRTDAEIARVERHLEEGFDGLCTGCEYCLPCPADIPIPRMMDSYNMLILEGEKKAVQERLHWQWSLDQTVAGQCTECGACEERCTQHLPIIRRLKEIRAL
ncbi:MAG TPA: aldo/keto reductase [Kiritimatiellia bacterium]|nr:aldo/keto reductase [Kiritimatiellia bacterium]HRZ13588.1 aldo/keto reductase [Kiritimatiellia bacterium]HSA19316.1 aldo/keto reductase [Kiritimatiellia bacterium]